MEISVNNRLIIKGIFKRVKIPANYKLTCSHMRNVEYSIVLEVKPTYYKTCFWSLNVTIKLCLY